ncbi:MAG: two-component sensor histidine kinase [Gammaproteobacteria bacterium]|nr:two-component sensor histidine kinase [Gammaproteobacteria bacterium]
MTPSIRTFLLINLLLSITLITSLAIIGNLFLEHKDLQKHLNAQLTVSALTIAAFVSDDISKRDISIIQKQINSLPQIADAYHENDHKKIFTPTYELIQFQVWDKNRNLVLSSSTAPKQALSHGKPGFSTKWIEGQLWHVFTTVDKNSGMRVDVAERSDFREELEGRVTQDSIFIMLITYPFLGLLIWIIVGRGLDSIKQVTNEIRQRAPSYLEPVDLEAVPTEIKPLIDELNKLFKRLREAFEREKRFAADAAHELRTPLAALRAQTQVALKAITETEMREALGKVLQGVDRSSHVVQQLLTLSRMVPQATIKEFEEVSIVKQARDVIADLAPAALEKNTEIELDAPEDGGTIMGYPTAVSILIRNLVDNAIRYTPMGSLIKVNIYSEKNNVILKVTDNGPGIPEELHNRVFERFFRILGNKTTGSGLGLGIVQQIVEIHDAEIILGSPQLGTGLEVTVVFMGHNMP